MRVLNSWNRKWYTVLKVTDKEVTLQREAGNTYGKSAGLYAPGLNYTR